MDLIESGASSTERAVAELRETVRAATAVVPVGSRTHWDVGGAPRAGVEVGAPSGIIRYDPADLTVTVGAGTSVAALAVALAEHGQECPLDPRDDTATVGGVLSAGLSGHRRLRHGPLRDRVLEVRLVTADGRLVKGGGPTVKNVSGYDLPRLLVGSLGTIGVLTQATLRAQPQPPATAWAASGASPDEVRRALFRPAAILWNGYTSAVLLEGDPGDIDAEMRAAGLEALDAPGALGAPPPWPPGRHRGRVSIAPGMLPALAAGLDAASVAWLAEIGVGTVHVGADEPGALGAARAAAERLGGWMLREAGAPDLDPFGVGLPNLDLLRRIKAAFDPEGRMNPGRLPTLDPRPLHEVEVEGSPRRAG